MLALLLLLLIPFWGKPVHIDDANFLVLAEGARADAWRPHAISINWQGSTELAFDVLSNPPGIAWWLAPMISGPVWLQHAWMQLWLLPAVWGAARLGDAFGCHRNAAVLLLLGSPIGLLSAQALTPDLPLFACVLAGCGGLITARSGRRWPWALLMGAAVVFRYSGVAMIPLAALWPVLHRDWRGGVRCGVAAALPVALLALHDVHAYGQVHLLAMVDFQGVSDDPGSVVRKLGAALAMLGGACVLPVLLRMRDVQTVVGGVAGALVGMGVVWLSALSGHVAVATVGFCCAGGMSWMGGVSLRNRRTLWAAAWIVGGLIFLLRLRFMATRYWLPFCAPAVLVPLAMLPRRRMYVATATTLGLSVLLSVDDLELARAQQDLAAQVVARFPHPGMVAGHWGWQHHLQRAGWQSLEEDAPLGEGMLLAQSAIAWPQESAPGCKELVEQFEATDRWWGPRVHTTEGHANVHAFVLSASPPVDSYAPWWVGDDPLDVVTVWRGCR